MAHRSQYAPGQFCWVDLMARDYDQAVHFYGALFGWTCEEQDTYGGPPYGVFSLGDEQVAGLGQMGDKMKASGLPSYWSNYVATEDVERTTRQAQRLGANVILEPMQVLEAGKMSILQDPSGASLSLWQRINHCGAQRVNEPNTWIWSELLTRDPEGAIVFYEQLFGWSFAKEPSSPQTYWTFKNGDRLNGGMMLLPPEMEQTSNHWATYFSVSNLADALHRVTSNGGHILVPPLTTDIGDISVVSDPLQGVFDLIELSVPADD